MLHEKKLSTPSILVLYCCNNNIVYTILVYKLLVQLLQCNAIWKMEGFIVYYHWFYS